MFRITKASLVQLAQEMRVLADQEQKNVLVEQTPLTLCLGVLSEKLVLRTFSLFRTLYLLRLESQSLPMQAVCFLR